MSGMAFGLLMNLTVPSVNVVVAMPDSAPVATTRYVATNQSGRVKGIRDLAGVVRDRLNVAAPAAAEIVVHEDVDALAGFPVRASQRDRATRRVVGLVACDRGRAAGHEGRRRCLRGVSRGGCSRSRGRLDRGRIVGSAVGSAVGSGAGSAVGSGVEAGVGSALGSAEGSALGAGLGSGDVRCERRNRREQRRYKQDLDGDE